MKHKRIRNVRMKKGSTADFAKRLRKKERQIKERAKVFNALCR